MRTPFHHMQHITVCCYAYELRKIERLIEEDFAPTRSEVVRAAILEVDWENDTLGPEPWRGEKTALGFYIPRETTKEIDAYVRRGGARSRSAAIRRAVDALYTERHTI